jgi:hypothetical protein
MVKRQDEIDNVGLLLIPELTADFLLQFPWCPIQLYMFCMIRIPQSHVVTFMILHISERRIEMKESSGMMLMVQVKGSEMGPCVAISKFLNSVENEGAVQKRVWWTLPGRSYSCCRVSRRQVSSADSPKRAR